MIRTPFSVAAAAVAVLAAPIALAQANDPARATVQTLCDGLSATMKADKAAGLRGREAVIGPVVDRTFDIPLMTRLSVGAGWTGIAPGDQQALVAAFRRVTVAQYAKNFDAYNGESFTVAPNVETRGGDRLVRTTLNQRSQPAIPIAYRLRESSGGWRIVDVFYKNSISQIATRRSDFAQTLQTGGAKALIAKMDKLATETAG